MREIKDIITPNIEIKFDLDFTTHVRFLTSPNTQKEITLSFEMFEDFVDLLIANRLNGQKTI